METANLVFQSNADMAQSFILTDWASLYNLSTGSFHAQMRPEVDSPIVLYEWSTALGNAVYTQTFANGFIVFTTNPTTGTIQVGTTTVAIDSHVGANLAATLALFRDYLNASIDTQLIQCQYSVSAGTTLNVVYKTAGSLGNTVALATSITGATVSGPFLTGAGGALTITAPAEDIEKLSGTYVYDMRWETSSIKISLFGGTMVFNEGVTRP